MIKPTQVVELHHTDLPPSINGLYYPAQGRLVLSSEGRKFKQQVVKNLGGLNRVAAMSLQLDPHAHYELHIWFLFQKGRLYNKNFGLHKSTKYRFTKVDTSNLVKVTEDVISELLGVDDRSNWTVVAHKRETTGRERLAARLIVLDLENDPYPAPPDPQGA